MTRNHMVLTFPSLAENESFARVAVAAFAVQLSPTLSEIADLKTAVSEAVTNAIVHGYEGCRGEITLRVSYDDRGEMTVEIERPWPGYPRCGPGHGALLYHAARAGAQRHGLFRHANLHG